jgi:hypothetical protein
MVSVVLVMQHEESCHRNLPCSSRSFGLIRNTHASVEHHKSLGVGGSVDPQSFVVAAPCLALSRPKVKKGLAQVQALPWFDLASIPRVTIRHFEA